MQTRTRWLAGGLAAIAMLQASLGLARADDGAYDIPLKLFGTDDIDEGLDSCRLSLWQKNRDPNSDRYAYLLNANFDGNGGLAPARLKIGPDFFFLTELVQGGDPVAGYGSHMLLATKDRKVRVHVEFLDGASQDGLFTIDDADVTVIQKGKVPFTASAQGLYGCLGQSPAESAAATPSADLPAGIPIGAEQLLGAPEDVPAALRQQMREYAADACEIDGFFAWAGARYVINDNYMLWQIPCFSGAYQGSGVFAVTQNPAGDWGELLTLPNPPALEGNQNYGAMNAEVVGDRGLIQTTELNSGAGDCGVRQVFRLIDGPGEVLELELLEYREKLDCDGRATDPATWPLAYRSY